MVDAAIGGKTGVNTRDGKNLVGAFWQPRGVICDLDALETLPPRERRSGDGETAKYHFLSGERLDRLPLAERIARCVAIKADVVASDEREAPGPGAAQTKGRALLNYGHTLAHALEIATDHDLTHGESVAIGLVYAAELAHRLGRIDAARVAQHRDTVGGLYGLPTAIPRRLDPERLVLLMGRDKKALDGLTFVLDGPDGVEVVAGVDPAVARQVLDAVA
jgi:5-deoxy-5-amino-3-dehydroquinate synthase